MVFRGNLNVVRWFNEALEQEACSQGCDVIDLYALTLGEGGSSNGNHHIDGYHLKPDVLREALAVI